MSFDEFAKREHDKRVDHFVRYTQETGRVPCLADAVEIFGFAERDAQPIVDDTIARLSW